VTGHVLRASDDDRQRVVAALERHTTAGRLSLDEFSERVSLVYAAATQSDLDRLTADLPAEPLALPNPATPEHRQLLLAFLLAMATIVVLGVLLALAK
jgi:hypothetical protein